MRKIAIPFILLCISVLIFAQNRLNIHHSKSITSGILLSDIDSLTFDSESNKINLFLKDNSFDLPVSSIDSISFGNYGDTVNVHFDGSKAYIINPLAFKGVSVTVENSDVVIKSSSETKNICYNISGTSSDGQLKIYSDKKFTIILNSLNLTNTNGPAINIQSEKEVSVILKDGTVNSICDGSTYSSATVNSDGETEDQKAAFFSEGQLIFSGSGKLNVTGKGIESHAICSDDYIQIDGGEIVVNSAVKDGIHAKDGFKCNNGTINITSSGECIDADEKNIIISGGKITLKSSAADVNCLTCDSTLEISGGTIEITTSGNQSKAIKSKQNISLSGGYITITTSGAAVLTASGSGSDVSYCAAIKCDQNISICGSNITITSTGAGGKGISSEKDIYMTGGTVKITTSGNGAKYTNTSAVADAYVATCITTNGNLNIIGGQLTCSSSGTGGKGISSDGAINIGDSNNAPVVGITTTGTKITISASTGGGGGPGGPGGQSTGDYAEAKAISADGAVTINNGTTTISSADDGIKSATSFAMNNGTLNITKSVEGIEGPLLTVNDGTVSIAASDDSFNATKGNGGESNDGSYLYLKGGKVYTNSTTGDGLDSNGNILMSGGTVMVQGPSSQPEVGLDYNGTFNITGGNLVITGPNSGNMIQATSSSSGQYSILVKSSSIGTNLFTILDSNGDVVACVKPAKSAYYVVVSSPLIKSGSKYTVYIGGSYSGNCTNGMYSDGTYTKGTLKSTVTVSAKVTTVSF